MKYKVLVGIPCNLESMSAVFVKSLTELDQPRDTVIKVFSEPTVPDMRNAMAQQAIDGGFTHLLMLDSDMRYSTDTIWRLLKHGKAIVGGYYLRRAYPHLPLYFPSEGESDPWLVNYSPPPSVGLLKVAAVSGGGVLIAREVFEEIPTPWFTYYTSDSGNALTEDIYFSKGVRDAGIEMWVDTGLIYGHMTTAAIPGQGGPVTIPLEIRPVYEDGKWQTRYFPV